VFRSPCSGGDDSPVEAAGAQGDGEGLLPHGEAAGVGVDLAITRAHTPEITSLGRKYYAPASVP
jgi:hypothetical protein